MLLDLGVKEENTPRKVSSKRLVHTTKGPPQGHKINMDQ